MKRLLYILAFITAVFSFSACKKPYEPPEIKVIMNLLVVDGTISVGNDAVSTFILSRTRRLSDSILFEPEQYASVYIEQEQGGSYLMEPKGEGVYQSQPLTLPAGRNYRLRVIVAGKEYLSSYVLAKTSPAIDSLTWKQDKDVTVSVHTHDLSNNTRYYRWEYVETWNFQSVLHTMWGVKNGMIFIKDSTTQTDSCWRTANSTNILVGSSIALSEDVISYFPLTIIPQHAEKISMGYSILVKQYSLSEQAFRYYQLIQKNTQQLGTLFDAQPSQLNGNIQCVDNPEEPVIGFVTASTVSEKRISIRNRDLVDWHFIAGGSCNAFLEVAVNPVDFRIYNYPDPTFAPYFFVSNGPLIVAPKACLDCTERGGTNVKPTFW